MEFKKEKHPHHHHMNMLLLIAVLLLVVVIVLVKPALLGYQVSKQFKDVNKTASEMVKSVENLRSDLTIAETNLESCEKLKGEYSESLVTEKEKNFNCQQDNDKLILDHQQEIRKLQNELNITISDYNKKKALLKNEKQELIEERDMYKESYDDLSQKSANNICCKAKVDDKEIDSYIIVDNKIVCSIGEEKEIDC